MRSTVQGSPPDAPDYGVTWGGVPLQAKRAMTVAVATLVAAGLFGPATASAASLSSSADQVSVIVREAAGSGNAPERAVAAYGGSITRELGIIGGGSPHRPRRPGGAPPRGGGGGAGQGDAAPAPPRLSRGALPGA